VWRDSDGFADHDGGATGLPHEVNVRELLQRGSHALSLAKDAPISRPIEQVGRVIAEPMLGGLHHRYARI
jgi:hypothetical protein